MASIDNVCKHCGKPIKKGEVFCSLTCFDRANEQKITLLKFENVKTN